LGLGLGLGLGHVSFFPDLFWCLSSKIKATEHDEQPFASIPFLLPKTIEILELKPVLGDDAVFLVEKIGVSSSKDIDFSIPLPPLLSSAFALHCLSLHLDYISDRLM
jgi:hypothetical protein